MAKTAHGTVQAKPATQAPQSVPAPPEIASSSGRARAAASTDIDTAILDHLIEITKQRRRLSEYRTRAESMRDKVDAAVYQRVIADYESRDAELDNEARPLKLQGRKEYEKLRAMYDAVNARDASAKFTKQELEFRHEVGEIGDAELAEKLRAPASILDECRNELADLDKQKARFLEAFDEEELKKPIVERTPVVEAAPAQSVQSGARAPVPAVGMSPVPPPIPEAMPAGALGAQSGAETYLGPAPVIPELTEDKPADATIISQIGSSRAPVSDAFGDEGTFLPPEAVIVTADATGAEVEHCLSAMTSIGRSADNQIRVQESGVSRRHALILAERNGYVIKDLQSQNGTFVNGERVEERSLASGDRICLGDAELVFRMPGRQ